MSLAKQVAKPRSCFCLGGGFEGHVTEPLTFKGLRSLGIFYNFIMKHDDCLLLCQGFLESREGACDIWTCVYCQFCKLTSFKRNRRFIMEQGKEEGMQELIGNLKIVGFSACRIHTYRIAQLATVCPSRTETDQHRFERISGSSMY